MQAGKPDLRLETNVAGMRVASGTDLDGAGGVAEAVAREVEGEDQGTRRRGAVGATGGCHGRRRNVGSLAWLGIQMGRWRRGGGGWAVTLGRERDLGIS
jgi:hypothetical protein